MSLLRDPDTGHLVGIEQKPHPVPEKAEYPKWVTPHESHVMRDPLGISTVRAPFDEFHVDRAGVVTVLVNDETEEREATSARPSDAGALVPVGDA